jgi:hypothetical protein
MDDSFIDAQLRRHEYPDGRCYRCGQKADRHAPVGPLIVTVVDGDDADRTVRRKINEINREIADEIKRDNPTRQEE